MCFLLPAKGSRASSRILDRLTFDTLLVLDDGPMVIMTSSHKMLTLATEVQFWFKKKENHQNLTRKASSMIKQQTGSLDHSFRCLDSDFSLFSKMQWSHGQWALHIFRSCFSRTPKKSCSVDNLYYDILSKKVDRLYLTFGKISLLHIWWKSKV